MDHAHVMTFHHHHQDQLLHQKHHQILIWFSWLMVQTVLMETTTREELPLVVTKKSKKYRGVTLDSHFIIVTHNSLTQWDGSLICSRMILVQTGEEKQPQPLSNSQVSKPWKNHMNQEQFESIDKKNANYRNPQNDTEQYRLTETPGPMIRLGLSVSRLPGGRVRLVAHAKFDTKLPISGSAVKPGKPLNGSQNGFQTQNASLKTS